MTEEDAILNASRFLPKKKFWPSFQQSCEANRRRLGVTLKRVASHRGFNRDVDLQNRRVLAKKKRV